jgi:hypothetical protein
LIEFDVCWRLSMKTASLLDPLNGLPILKVSRTKPYESNSLMHWKALGRLMHKSPTPNRKNVQTKSVMFDHMERTFVKIWHMDRWAENIKVRFHQTDRFHR